MEKAEIVLYAVKVFFILGIFYGCYHWLMRNRSNHGLNRAYLLGTMILALIVPVVDLPFAGQQETTIEQQAFGWIGESMWDITSIERVAEASVERFPAWTVLQWVYLLFAGVLVCRALLHLVFLHQLKRESVYVKKKGYKLYRTAHSKPFSFLSDVFIPDQLFGTEAFDQILAHECAHVRQLHSFDRLLVDFYVALFWFNPFIYLYRKALIETHEYQADEAVIVQFKDTLKYQEVLYTQLSLSGRSGLVSHFNFSIIKKRIVMMNKINNKRSGWFYLLTIPVICSVIFAFSSKEVKYHLNWIEGEISVMMAPAIPALAIPDTVPSILPIKVEEGSSFRMSSGFGMRFDPILKVRKLHHGMDLAAPTGTPVLASADGEVMSVTFFPEGYGKKIEVKHGVAYVTIYAQLSGFNVKEGQWVRKGDVIGYVGSSGRSTAPHLHYEVLKDGQRVDPKDYISDYKFAGNE